MSQLAASLGKKGAGANGARRVEEARGRLGGFETEDSRSDAIPMRPQRIIAELQRALLEDGMVTADAGENRIFLAHHFRPGRQAPSCSPPRSEEWVTRYPRRWR